MDMRPTVFAGSWYPATAAACEKEIKQFQSQMKVAASSDHFHIGGIVPHAGWFYSGAIACRVIEALSLAAQPDTLLIFGRHMHAAAPPVIMPQGAWQTPFGPLAVDESLARELESRFDFERETPDHFEPDNTIELQLPFIKYFFPEAAIVALGVPPTASALAMGKTAVEIGQEQHKRLAVIGSTDLTHYGANYGFTPHGRGPQAVNWVREDNDAPMVAAMEALDATQVIDQARV
ncbi:MAG: AmmeMemoRadiSam system protein B, partial [Desulfobacterales bacterium]